MAAPRRLLRNSRRLCFAGEPGACAARCALAAHRRRRLAVQASQGTWADHQDSDLASEKLSDLRSQAQQLSPSSRETQRCLLVGPAMGGESWIEQQGEVYYQ